MTDSNGKHTRTKSDHNIISLCIVYYWSKSNHMLLYSCAGLDYLLVSHAQTDIDLSKVIYEQTI